MAFPSETKRSERAAHHKQPPPPPSHMCRTPAAEALRTAGSHLRISTPPPPLRPAPVRRPVTCAAAAAAVTCLHNMQEAPHHSCLGVPGPGLS